LILFIFLIKLVFKSFGISSTRPGDTLETRMGEFYEAEKDALDPQSVRESFALVGLHPWNKSLILKNCRENSPVVPQPNRTASSTIWLKK